MTFKLAVLLALLGLLCAECAPGRASVTFREIEGEIRTVGDCLRRCTKRNASCRRQCNRKARSTRRTKTTKKVGSTTANKATEGDLPIAGSSAVNRSNKRRALSKKKARRAKQTFVHPGVLNTMQSISYVRTRLGQEPWKLAFDRMRESEFANLAYVSQPVPSVDCGPYNQPDTGCTNQRRDGIAAYTHALLWSFTGDSTYAKKAQEILDSWASIHTQFTLENAGLMAAWSSEMYPRVGELLISTDWPGRGRFKRWLANVIYPVIKNGRPTTAGGNWDMSMADGLIQTGVFLDSPTMFNKGISLWKDRVRAYFYLKSDGPLPVSPRKPVIKGKTRIFNFWNSPSKLVNGFSQETCRDIIHTNLGLSGTINAAETAWIQGVDLYKLEAKRITKAMEFHAKLIVSQQTTTSLCKNGLIVKAPTVYTYEMGYNHFVHRLKMRLPYTQQLLEQIRPTGADLWNPLVAWETLTHSYAPPFRKKFT